MSDPITFRHLATLKGHKDTITTWRRLADGRILTGSADKTLKIWDSITYQCVATLQEHKEGITACLQLTDGRVLSCSEDNIVIVWDPVTYKCLAKFDVEGKVVYILGGRESYTQRSLLHYERPHRVSDLHRFDNYFSYFGRTYLDMNPPSLLSPPKFLIFNWVTIVLQLADGRILGVVGKTLKVWDPVTFEPLATLRGHHGQITACLQLVDGRLLSSSEDDKTVKVWDPVTFECITTLQGDEDQVTEWLQLTDGYLVSYSKDKVVKVWDPVIFKCLDTFDGNHRQRCNKPLDFMEQWDVPCEKATLQVDQLTRLARVISWRDGKLVGPRNVDMRPWFDQLQQFLRVILPGATLHCVEENIFQVKGRDRWEEALAQEVVRPLARRGS